MEKIEELADEIRLMEAELNNKKKDYENLKKDIDGSSFNPKDGQLYYFLDSGNIPAGTQFKDCNYAHLKRRDALNCYRTLEAAELQSDRLKTYKQAINDISQENTFDIFVLLPLLPRGWVAMDKDGSWRWYQLKPEMLTDCFNVWNSGQVESLRAFNIKPAKNWKESLFECGL